MDPIEGSFKTGILVKKGGLSDLEKSDPVTLTINSMVEDFRAFQSAMRHPGLVLNLIPKDAEKTTTDDFTKICDNVLICLGEFEASLEDMTIWKNDFLKQSVPLGVKLEMTMLFSKLYRR